MSSRRVGGPVVPALLAAGCDAVRRPNGVTALGRLEPKDGILRIAGPSRPSVVIAKRFVDEGDRVLAGQALAELDSIPGDGAWMTKAKAEAYRTRRMAGGGMP